MDNLSNEDLKQLVTFYKQRANELEFIGLQNQLLINNLLKQNAQIQQVSDNSETAEVVKKSNKNK